MATKKLKLEEEAIIEILVADTDSESGAEVSDVEEDEQQQQQIIQQASAQDKPQAATSGGVLPPWEPPQGRNINVHPFFGPAKCVKKSEAPHVNKDSSPLSVLMLFFTEIFHLLVEQTHLYYEQFLDRQAGPNRRLPDITLTEMMTFIALALQMGHVLKDTLHDYWSRLRQTRTPFFGETMARDRFLHILCLLHFADNSQRPDQSEECDRLWKLRTVFDTSDYNYAKFYNSSENLAVDEVIVKYRVRVIFGSIFQRKENVSASKFTNCAMKQGIRVP